MSTPRPKLGQILASRKMAAILLLGAASGLPYNLTDSTLQAWLRDYGVSLTQIGLLTLAGLPYAWKFLWAPLFDRFSMPILGRRRGWILLLQLLLAAAIAVAALQSPTHGLMAIAIATFVIAFLSASQDIVIDAYRTDVAQPHERGLAATATSLGYRSAAYLSFAGALILADVIGWRATYFILAGAMLLLALGTLMAPEPEHRIAPPRSFYQSIVEPLRQFIATPGMIGLIVLLLLYKVGDAFALRLFTPFLMDVGFTKLEIGAVAKFVMTGATIAGTILGGLWMIRLGLLRSLFWFGVMQAVANLSYMILALSGKDYGVMVTAVAIDNLAGGMGSVAVVAFIMALCDQRFSAFQYALLSAIAVMPRTYLGWPAGILADHSGWPTYYLVSFFIAIPGIAMVWLLRDRLRELDALGKA